MVARDISMHHTAHINQRVEPIIFIERSFALLMFAWYDIVSSCLDHGMT